MKHLIIALVFLISCVTVANSAELKVGFVDLQKAVSQSAAGIAAKAKIDKAFKAVQVEAKKRQADLVKFQEATKKQLALLSDEAKQEKQLEFNQRVTDFQRFTDDKKKELQMKDTAFSKQILSDLAVKVKVLCKDKGISMMLEKGQLVYAVDGIDYTDELIKAYDIDYKGSHK